MLLENQMLTKLKPAANTPVLDAKQAVREIGDSAVWFLSSAKPGEDKERRFFEKEEISQVLHVRKALGFINYATATPIHTGSRTVPSRTVSMCSGRRMCV